MSIQKDFKDIEDYIKAPTALIMRQQDAVKKWENLTKWCNKHNMFGPYGYDFENDNFLKEPEDPSQLKLFNE